MVVRSTNAVRLNLTRFGLRPIKTRYPRPPPPALSRRRRRPHIAARHIAAVFIGGIKRSTNRDHLKDYRGAAVGIKT